MFNKFTHVVGLLLATVTCVACTGAAEELEESSQAATSGDRPPGCPVRGGSFSSTGDPHERSGDGAKWDNSVIGTFTAVKSLSAYAPTEETKPWRFMIQKTHADAAFLGYPGAAVNTKVGILVGSSAVVYDASTKTLSVKVDGASTFNGKLPNGKMVTLGLGATVKAASWNGLATILVVGPKGDTVTVVDRGGYLDLYGVLSKDRRSDYVRGELGAFDADRNPGNDARSRDGNKTFNMTIEAEKSAFFKAWTTTAAEALY